MDYICADDDSALYDNNGLIFCGECNHFVAWMNRELRGYRLVVVCRCGEIKVFKHNAGGLKQRSAGKLYLFDGECVCPKCGRKLLKVCVSAARGISFYVKCSCGAVYNQEYQRLERRGIGRRDNVRKEILRREIFWQE